MNSEPECPIWAEYREAAEAAIADMRANPSLYVHCDARDVWAWARDEYDARINGARVEAYDGYEGPTWYEGMGWA